MTPQVQVVLPESVDDPAAPSGGNAYDRRLCHGLAGSGWSVRELPVGSVWPQPGPDGPDRLAGVLAALPDGAVVLLDGLVACAAPEAVTPHAGRLRLAVLVHLPLADETGLAPQVAADLDARERRTLHAAAAVVATSGWAARRLVDHHRLPASRVHIAAPGVDPAPLAPGTDGASALLCVAAVTPRKGQDLLLEALSRLPDLDWRCVCAGANDRDAGYTDRVRERAAQHRLAQQFQLVGPRSGAELADTYAAADLLVLPSHTETYGMVITEALARGIPVLATQVGGVPEALGPTPHGGMLVARDDLDAVTDALAAALRRWLTEPGTRRRLRRAARARRATLPNWQTTVATVAEVLRRLP